MRELNEAVRQIAERARGIEKPGGTVVIAIDGRCASGKTTLADALGRELGCEVFRMDDFFLRPEQRTPERYAEPGGNVDRERFSDEVLEPLSEGKAFCYRPFECSRMALGESVEVSPGRFAVVEGSYSCHPELVGRYDLKVFLTISPEEQLERLARRDAGKLEAFRTKWIPLEERYFEAFRPDERCDLKF